MYTAGQLIDAPGNFISNTEAEAETEAEIRAEVQLQAEAGVDYVKLYMGISDSLVAAAIDQARSEGVRVLGHLKQASWTVAAESGIDGLVHSCSEGPTWELLGPDAHASFRWADGDDWGDFLRSWAQFVDSIATDGSRMSSLIRVLIANEVEVNPTLVVMEALYWADDSEHLELQQPSFAPEGFAATWSENWRRSATFMRGLELTDDQWQELKEGFRTCGEMIKTFHERGVLLTTGSDVGGWMTPGVSLHREFELLVEAGIPTLDVIKIATHNGARALGILDEIGTLEPGKIADIVVLQRNPVHDIRNTQTIVSVFIAGREYSPESLLKD